MRSDERDPTDWQPSPQHHALISVALAPTAAVAETWARYRNEVPVDALDTLDGGARRLVPLVAWRLREAGIDDAGTAPLRADLSASMLAARATMSSFAAVVETFEEAGFETLVLKGVGIAPLAYPDPGTRPVSDLDVLVRVDDLAALEELVARHGGYRTYGAVDPVLRARYRHAATARIAGHDVDLHWRLLVDRFDGRPDAGLFDRSLDIPLGPGRALTLGVEDHIVHAIAHGIRRNSLAPVRWIVDVARLVEGHAVDWAVIEEQAALRHVEGVVSRALDFVGRRYQVPVPDATVEALRRAGGTRGRADVWSRSPKRTRVGGAVNVAAAHYVLATQGWTPVERVARYPEYLRFRRTADDRTEAEAAADPGPMRWHG